MIAASLALLALAPLALALLALALALLALDDVTALDTAAPLDAVLA